MNRIYESAGDTPDPNEHSYRQQGGSSDPNGEGEDESSPLVTVDFSSPSASEQETEPSSGRTYSVLVSGYSIPEIELANLEGKSGSMLFFPDAVQIEIGDVFYLRERGSDENGLIVQVIQKETASYPQVESKVLWRLLTAVRADQLQRSHHEPTEIIDQFLVAVFKVRASIVMGKWTGSEGRVVTRNVDIFEIDPSLLTKSVLRSCPATDIDLGEFQGQSVAFAGEGFDKINVVTGMKGAGKSHITKGVIDESRKKGMTAVVFDINGEYKQLPGAVVFTPGENLKFRLDRVSPRSFVEIIQRHAPFAERTGFGAVAEIPRLIEERKKKGLCPDLAFMRSQDKVVFPGTAQYLDSMRSSYRQSLDVLERIGLFLKESEAKTEDEQMRSEKEPTHPTPLSLSSSFQRMVGGGTANVFVVNIGGLMPDVQLSVVSLVIDTLKSICQRQNDHYLKEKIDVPVYPTIYFEEAHMYMEPKDINTLVPVIRHLGMNLFFITNTPGDLPDSVFRLVDNVLVTRMLNDRDISRVSMCGLVDRETIESFAPEIPDHHALMLSGKDRITSGFPLLFHVRDFGLPTSGATRSMWRALEGVPTTAAGNS